jgi:NAD(P)-dependent dehydrogenase (short-subunit alcohol dehydrogenase family)
VNGDRGSTSLRGAVAVVTGAASGIGLATARALSAEGALVTGFDLSPSVRDADWGDGAVVDVGDEAQVVLALHDLVRRHGRLDILVNNAGLARHGPVQHLRAADLDLMWHVNVRAVVLLCREAFRLMIVQGGGQVVNVVSTAGLRGEPGESAYCATKHAVRGFTEGIAEEGRLHGIRVHAVFPAGVDTAFWSSASATPMPRETLDAFLRPEDVASGIVAALAAPPYLQTQMAVLRSLGDADLDHIRRRMARFETAAGA